jgi:hypothetical protein
VEAALAVWIDDAPTGCLKDGVLTGLADAHWGVAQRWRQPLPPLQRGPEPSQLHRHRRPLPGAGDQRRSRARPHQGTAADRRSEPRFSGPAPAAMAVMKIGAHAPSLRSRHAAASQ